ncbi:phage/plasmid primase, P4 family [Mycobacteroides abscessus subsp. massiliense]|uniref:phage/plasmid primase, P4 family n=1 Tax=Mycobacteroides abscessus TaxID=36809 RepID=UPI0009A8E284|nr:phage/plasmid primase, P4 family [Mycobacteroides abscessus]SLI53799.1 phage/plasmid primase, P4 family, C-terminal domain protein [Mycobacteroides abscessus subsp. massiliense]
MTATSELPAQPLNEKDRTSLIEGAACTQGFLDAHPHLVRSVETSIDLRLASDRNPWEHLKSRPQGLLFVWNPLDGSEPRYQFRSDAPSDGEGKYQFEPSPRAANHGVVRAGSDDGSVALVEGFKKALSVASTLAESDDDTWVIALPGCSAWSTGDWSPDISLVQLAEGRDVLICMDADAGSNLKVHEGAERLGAALSNADSVRFIQVPGGGKTGIDDYLTVLPVEKRVAAWNRLVARSTTKPSARRPKPKKGKELPSAEEVAKRRADAVAAVLTEQDEDETDAAGFRKVTGAPADAACWFDAESGAFLPESLSRAILDSGTPVAAALDGNLAVYSPKGFYRITLKAFSAKVGRFLGDRFSPNHLANVRERTHGLCEEFDRVLPERPTVPLLNVKNGMLDILTGKLFPHDPKYLSTYQIDVDWNPEATCPTYDSWLLDRVGPYQVDVVNEVISQFLDPLRVPSKGLFLFGPNKTGKSTLLRIAKKMAGGDERVAALTLQQLSGDHFAAAELYGKVINVSADLPKDHVNDLSVFKRVTGGDPLTVNKKYGQMFTFQANSLFLFSANTLPTVDSAEGASYLDRTVPVVFPRKFTPDPRVEEVIMTELPGILVKWVQARRAHIERGFAWLPVPPAVHGHFAADSDRVSRFIATCCITGVPASTQKKPEVPASAAPKRTFGPVVTPTALRKWPEDRCPTLSELHEAFEAMIGQERGKGMGLTKFKKRLSAIDGVSTEKFDVLGRKVVNVLIKPQDDWEPPSDYQSLIPALFPENGVVETPAVVPAAGTVTPIHRTAARRRRYWTKQEN